ncbi:MAG: alkaline phosphatase family protein [Phycisphaerae bacterium]
MSVLCCLAWLIAGCSVPGPDHPADSYEIDFSLPPGSEVAGAIVFVVDGMNAEIFQQMLEAGQLPAFQKYFVDRGLYVPRAAANIPGVTLANLTSLATGRFCGHHNIPGINWFDRNTLIYRNYNTIAQKNTLDGDYQVPNIYEQFPRQTTVSIFFQPHRNTTKFIENWTSAGPMFGLGWYERVDRLTLYRFHLVRQIAAARRAWPAITVAYLLSPDFRGYGYGSGSEQYRDSLRHSDKQIGRVLADLESAGMLEKLHIALVSDHGMVDIREHFVLDDYLRDMLGLNLACRELWQTTPFEKRQEYYQQYQAVTYGSGDRYGALCLRKPVCENGKVVGWHDWLDRPGPADLASYPTGRGIVDLPAHLAGLKQVDLVAWQVRENHVAVRNGLGVVHFTQPQGPAGLIWYQVVQGDDPLGYDALVPEHAGNGASPLAWLEATARTEYPDLPAQILAYFRSTRAGDIALFAAEGYDFRDVHNGGHGGFLHGEAFVPMAIAGPGIERQRLPIARTVDLVPTLLDLLGAPPIEAADGRSLVKP